MADLHTLLVIDSETGKVRLADLAECPLDTDNWVFDGADWRPPTDDETATVLDVDQKIIAALEAAGLRA